MNIVLADFAHDTLKPLTYTRSVSDLEIGGQTVFEHVSRKLEQDTDVLVPEYLEDITEKNSELYDLDREVNPEISDENILYNSSVIPNSEITEKISELETGEALFYEETFIAGQTSETPGYEELEDLVDEFNEIDLSEEPIHLEYPWDFVDAHPELMNEFFKEGDIKGDIAESAEIRGSREKLYLGENSELMENTVIDTSDGPVYIDSDTKVLPNSRIEGPTYIGSHTKVGAGQDAVIHEGTHIGDVTRVGGELEEAIINSFTNKYHYGFLGHAVVGSWVNFGAGTTNSDLKNTYGDVKVQHPEKGILNAGLKVGASIADHTKTDIGTLIYTGKQIGPVAKISDKVLGNVEPFTWSNPGTESGYVVEKAVEHAERMMSRREEHLPEGYIEAQKNLIRKLSEIQG